MSGPLELEGDVIGMSAASVSVPLTHNDIALLCMGLAYLASDAAVFPEARELLYRLEAAAKPFGP